MDEPSGAESIEKAMSVLLFAAHVGPLAAGPVEAFQRGQGDGGVGEAGAKDGLPGLRVAALAGGQRLGLAGPQLAASVKVDESCQLPGGDRLARVGRHVGAKVHLAAFAKQAAKLRRQ